MSIPIIGQPQVCDWFFTFTIKCPCGTTTMIVGQPGATRPCDNPECDTVFRLLRMPSIEGTELSVPLGTASKRGIAAAIAAATGGSR